MADLLTLEPNEHWGYSEVLVKCEDDTQARVRVMDDVSLPEFLEDTAVKSLARQTPRTMQLFTCSTISLSCCRARCSR